MNTDSMYLKKGTTCDTNFTNWHGFQSTGIRVERLNLEKEQGNHRWTRMNTDSTASAGQKKAGQWPAVVSFANRINEPDSGSNFYRRQQRERRLCPEFSEF